MLWASVSMSGFIRDYRKLWAMFLRNNSNGYNIKGGGHSDAVFSLPLLRVSLRTFAPLRIMRAVTLLCYNVLMKCNALTFADKHKNPCFNCISGVKRIESFRDDLARHKEARYSFTV